MDFPSLKAFVAVAEAGSFSRAADRLFMTQPAVSKRIASLEDNLGSPLFDRLGKHIKLTEAGEKFLISARRILSDIDTSREEVLSLSTKVSGRLRLATSHHVGIHRLPPILKTFTQAHPQVELDLLFMDSEMACAEVAKGNIELAVVTLPDDLQSGLLTNLVWADPLSIVCAKDHPMRKVLASNGKPKQLERFKAVLPGRGTVTRTILFDALQPYGVNIETALETNYLETIKVMVSVGLGWSALPVSMLDDDICAIEMPDLNMLRKLGAVRLKGRTLSRAATAFMGLLERQADFAKRQSIKAIVDN